MVALSPEAQSHLERYIRQIKMALREHSSVDADEVERDVLGHIETELAGQPEPVDAGQLLDVLDRLGTPDEWLPTETAFERSYPLPSRAEDWRFAYLTLAIFLAGPALFLPMLLWPLPPLLFVLSFLCARVTVARAAERDEQLGARRWLVYPALVAWYGVFLVALVGGPALFTAVFVADDPMLPSRLTSWFGEPAWIGALSSIGALLGIWWMLLRSAPQNVPPRSSCYVPTVCGLVRTTSCDARLARGGHPLGPLGGDSRTSSAELTSMPLVNRSWLWVIDVRRDVVHAARLLRRNPLVTTTAVLSLAIGIGASTTVFTVAKALLFQPSPGVAAPSRLVDIGATRSGVGFGPSSYPDYLDISKRATTINGVYAYSRFPQPMSAAGGGAGVGAESIFGSLVTVNYFTVLGAVPALGRLFGGSDSDQPGASPIVVLSHRFWSRRFNSDPGIVGQTLRLNQHPFTVIGVASEGFHGTGIRALDVWVPMGMVAAVATQGTARLTDRGARWLLIGARIESDVSISQTAAELEVIGRTLEREDDEQNRQVGLRVLESSPIPGNRGPVVAFLALIVGIVSIVLIIACANLAGVLLARATARRSEMALRLAIGAGPGRLIRQLLTETILLFVLGGMAGLMLARGVTSLLVSRLPTLPFPVFLTLTLDWRVIAFAVALSLIAALLSGLAPAVEASKTDVLAGLRNDGPRVGRLRLRHAFVIGQVAFSLVLIITAGLFTRALHRAATTDPGFDAHGVELMSIDLTQGSYTNATGRPFVRELVDRVRLLPGVQTATIASALPGGFEVRREALTVPDGSAGSGQGIVSVDWNVIEPEYFATLKIPIVAGRDFTAGDRNGAPPVAIVSETAARQFWPRQSVVGKYLLQPTWGPQGATGPVRRLVVVGVARDVQSTTVIDGLTHGWVYVPFQQQYLASMTIVVRTDRGQRIADELRALLASMNPNLPIVTAQTLGDSVALGLAPQRVAAAVAGSLGIVGVLLTGIGIYGVMAYAVTRRTREIGIRVALGARRADVISMVLREGLFLTAIGSAIGAMLAAAAARVLAGFLFGIPPIDPITFAATTVLFATIGLVACYVPVLRATRVDPTQALRFE